MDWGSLAGITLAFAGILLGQALEGGSINSLLQPAAFLVVVFGTLGAVLIQSQISHVVRGLGMLRWIIFPPTDDRRSLALRIVRWSGVAYKDGFLSLEAHLAAEEDAFIQKGLRLMIDGVAPEKIQEICGIDLDHYEAQQRSAAKIWDAAGGYAPTIGILGAVLGLIHVMENLSDPSKLGSGIAVAFVATIYGVGFANLIFLPVASKLKALIQIEVTRREMLLDSLVSIADGAHPRMVEERLESFAPSSKK
jgi:chemotaxis protein MotA